MYRKSMTVGEIGLHVREVPGTITAGILALTQ
jgi:hypothetical protein